jgi:hypothetical protein
MWFPRVCAPAAHPGPLFLFAVVVGLVGRVTLEQFLLAGLLPFLPVFVIGMRQFTEQRQTATRLDDLKKHAERLWTCPQF